MAISQAVQGDFLDVWRDYAGIDLWRFNQVLGLGVLDTAQQAIIQPERERIGSALYAASSRLQHYLKFPVRKTFIASEEVLFDTRRPIYGQVVRLKNRYVQSIGARAVTLIEAGATVTYSNVGGLVDDTATVTVTTTADADEIALFFRVADGAPSAANDVYRIMPISVTKSGNTATITGHRALFVKPSAFWQKPYVTATNLDRNSADTTDATDFVTQVDVYRVYADATSAIVLTSDPANCGTTTDTALTGTLINADESLVRLTYSGSVCVGYGSRLRVSYVAGAPLINGEVDFELAQALARLSMAYLPHLPQGALGHVDNVWQADTELENIPQTQQANPFGVSKGAFYAWQVVQNRSKGWG